MGNKLSCFKRRQQQSSRAAVVYTVQMQGEINSTTSTSLNTAPDLGHSTTTSTKSRQWPYRSQSPKVAALASAQYQTVLRTNFDHLVEVVGPVISEVAVKAFANKLISKRHKSDAENPHNNEYDRASKLLERILNKIRENDAHFETFIAILREIPVLEDMADELDYKACEQERTSIDEGVPRLNLSPAVQMYAERLKDLYSKRKMPDYLKGRQLQTKNFVNLALISRQGVSKEDMDKFTRSTVNEGNVDAIFQKKAPLEMTEIGKLKGGTIATCMLFQGGPGVGKTTLAWNLCREWECGELFQEYSLVVFVPLRRKAIRKGKEIRELFSIGNADSEIQKAICDEILNNQGESVLLVLDGYDELPTDVQQDSKIARVVSGELLPKASVLITSRPSVCDKLTDKCRQRDENFQHIEVLGFTKDKINAYIEDNVQDSKQLKQFHEYQSSHPKIYTMMYNPLQCALTVEVCKKIFADGSGLPNTRTKLYETNILMTMSREHSFGRINSLRKLPQVLHKTFVELCHLAYDGILKRQIIFEDVSEEMKSIGLLVCEPDMDSVSLSSENYNFFHLTIQEFCAAYYICSLPEQLQEEIIRLYCNKAHFREVIIFVCGICDNPERMVDVVYSCVLDYDSLFLLHCAFESQCTITCASLVKKWNLSIDFRNQPLTPSDMSAVGFIICRSEDQTNGLYLIHCSCGDDEVQALISQFHHTLDENSSLSIETINLSDNNIGADGTKCLSEGLKHCPKLQALFLSKNNIGYDGAKCLSEGLKCCPELLTLEELNLSDNNIGAAGTKYLSEGFKYCPKLQILYLPRNDIGDDGAKCLSEGLKHCRNLQTLHLDGNNIGANGAECLSEGLKYCPELQTLNLFCNHIGDIGARGLSEELKYCPKLRTLDLSNNKIGDTGAKCLSEGLKYCPKLHKLFVGWNLLSYKGKAALEMVRDEINLKRRPDEPQLDIKW